MKKVFIISSVLLAIALIFLGIYNFVYKNDSPEQLADAQKSSKNGGFLSGFENEKKISVLVDSDVSNPILNATGKTVLYYSKSESKAKSLILDGTGRINEISFEDRASGLSNAIISPKGDKIILAYKNGESTSIFLYEASSKSVKKIKDGIDDVFWDGLGNKIIYKYFDSRTGKRTINIADPDGANWKPLAELPYRYLSASPIPTNSVISFWNSPDANQETILQTAGIMGGEVKKIFSGKYGADYLWSPDGKRALVSATDTADKSKIFLGIINGNGGEYRNFAVPTMVSKCVWTGNDEIIYAQPGSVPEGSVLPNDYLSGKFKSADTFWKMNVNDLKKERLIGEELMKEINEKFDAANLIYSPEEDALLFVNRYNGKLYELKL
ncbi:MAG: hypothetical protein A3E91_01915 [Candidatus Moranbacteria bacterium RIFCSPHIGHO2_12_FULL_40_10]|nr:MAG: hypothetical protein A3E91_01915 [Candidatus Moranbacteria bacterium RIFCSPHIGHO2_12_FULL_40_10]